MKFSSGSHSTEVRLTLASVVALTSVPVLPPMDPIASEKLEKDRVIIRILESGQGCP